MPQGQIQFPEDTLLEGVSFEDYKAINAINASGLKLMLRSPAHFMANKICPKPDTPALRAGRLIHQAVLEADSTNFVVSPEYNLRTKQGKEDLAKWRNELPDGATEVNKADMEQLTGMRAAAREHKILRNLLAKGRSEVTLLWRDAAHDGALCKMRADWVADETLVLVDLKTTTDARHDAFSKDAYKFGYLLQAAHYTEGARVTGTANGDQFAIVAIEKSPPFGICLYTMSTDSLNLGHQQRHLAMERYVACVQKNEWPGYDTSFDRLEPPSYARSP